MATDKLITMKQFNGTDYDSLYPKTKVEQVEGAYTQQQILANATKSLYGLGSNAIPDNAFASIKTLIDSANSNANKKLNIETGSYVGTGKYGNVANATKVILSNTPKVFFCGSGGYFVLIVNGALTTGDGNSNTTLVSFTNTVSWYDTNSVSQQLNDFGKTYQYFALY